MYYRVLFFLTVPNFCKGGTNCWNFQLQVEEVYIKPLCRNIFCYCVIRGAKQVNWQQRFLQRAQETVILKALRIGMQ